MNVFDHAVGKVFGASLNTRNTCRPETAIGCLALLVEKGRKFWEKDFRDSGFNFYAEVTKFLYSARPADITQNKIIIESLLIALVQDIKSSESDENAAQKLFFERLREIFPPELAKRLYERGINTFYECRTGKNNFLPTTESWKQHYDEIKKALGAQECAVYEMEKMKDIRLPGTETIIVKCPKCLEEKRCDKNTKRFRCKKCGLDRPYPFS